MSPPVLPSLRERFAYYRHLAERAIQQMPEQHLNRRSVPEGNSVSALAAHLAGNLRSRFTHFYTEDGEKPWRGRDGEFESSYPDRAALLADWAAAWQVLEDLLADMTEADLGRHVLIRNEAHSVLEALLRQLGHYSYHVGQIVELARQFTGNRWESLSIPRGESAAYNAQAFRKHGGKDAR